MWRGGGGGKGEDGNGWLSKCFIIKSWLESANNTVEGSPF